MTTSKISESEHFFTCEFLQFLILENFQRLKFLKVKVLVQQNKCITNVPYGKYHISHGLIAYYWWKIPRLKASV